MPAPLRQNGGRAAANDHVMQSAGDAEIAIGLPHPQVAGVQPSFAVDDGCCFFWHVVITEHHAVAAATELALLAIRKRLVRDRINDFCFESGQRTAYRADPQFDRIVGASLRDQR